MKAREIVLVIVAAAAIVVAVYYKFNPPPAKVYTEYVMVPEEKPVAKIPKQTLPGPKKVVVIDKKQVAKIEGFDWLMNDGTPLEPIANADIPPSDGGTSVFTFLNMSTGQGHVYAKPKLRPLLELTNDYEVGVRYGFGTRSGQEANLFARWQFFRISNIHLGLYGEVGSRPEAKGMIEAVWSR